MASLRLRTKVYKYACFFFPEGNQVGTAPTANVCEGHREKIKTGEWVMVSWEGKQVWGKILKLHGKWWSVDSSKFFYGHFLHKRKKSW